MYSLNNKITLRIIYDYFFSLKYIFRGQRYKAKINDKKIITTITGFMYGWFQG